MNTNQTEVAVAELNKDKRSDLHQIDPRKIAPNPNNHRQIDVNSDDMQELIASIRANGIITPLMLKPNPEFGKTEGAKEYVSYAGNRRITAVDYLINVEGMDIKYVPCQVKKNVSLETEFLTQIIENSGKPFTLLEKAEVFRELIEICSWTPADIEKSTGESQAIISNLLRIGKMNKKHKKMIADNTITATFALQIARESENEEEFDQKMEELFNLGENLKASGKVATKRALVTEKDAKSVVVKKKPLVILEEVCYKLEQKGIDTAETQLLNKIVEQLRKQTKSTEKNIIKLFTEQ